jgi:hypothetical protein
MGFISTEFIKQGIKTADDEDIIEPLTIYRQVAKHVA